MKTAYLNHPLTADRKKEHRAKGYRIIDARFAPDKPADGDFVDKPKAKPKKD